MTSVSKGQIPDEELSSSEQTALRLIQNRDGLYQSQLWKAMDRSSRAGSRIAKSLAEKGLITREETTHNGRKTYKLETAVQDSPSDETAARKSDSRSELQEVSPMARTIIKILDQRGETPISRIDREVDGSPEDVDEAMGELLEREIVEIGRETLYGRETDVVSFAGN